MGRRAPLLVYLTAAGDPQRLAVAPALAAAAERAGWGFDLYHAELRRGRHFGGGDPAAARPGIPSGGLVAGGRHADRVLWLAGYWDIFVLGAPRHPLWPAFEVAGATVLARSTRPEDLYEAAFDALDEPVPSTVAVLDAEAGGPGGLIVAPFLYPAILGGAPSLLDPTPCIALEAGSDEAACRAAEGLGARRFVPLGLDPGRAAAFPRGFDALDPVPPATTYADLTADLAERASDWAEGVLLGDPALVAAQLPKARRLRLAPLHGRPQVDVVAAADATVRRAREPVFGRQYDDRDFFALAQRGRGLQVLDPGPPFDAAHVLDTGVPAPPPTLEPSDRQLEQWADEGRVLSTLLLWCGMLRELDALPRLVDLVAETGLRAGLVVTAETIEHGSGSSLDLLAVPRHEGGVFGHLDLLLGSTGRGVAAEAEMPPGALTSTLAEANAAIGARLPRELLPKGWWPLLDTSLVTHRSSPVSFRRNRPILRYTPRDRGSGGAVPAVSSSGGSQGGDLRALAGRAVRRSGLDSLFEERRPFDDRRPGAIHPGVAAAVQASGFAYMVTKAQFGTARVALRRDDFVALPSTAGRWDGWSPFYTVGEPGDLARAELRLRAGRRPGWLMSTIDSPLWALSGEVWEHGSVLHRIATLTAAGGYTGELINVTPNVVARYARLLDDRR